MHVKHDQLSNIYWLAVGYSAKAIQFTSFTGHVSDLFVDINILRTIN